MLLDELSIYISYLKWRLKFYLVCSKIDLILTMKIEALLNINTRFSKLTFYYLNKLCLNKLFEKVYIYAWNTNTIRGNPIKVFIPFLYPTLFFSIFVSVFFKKNLKHKLWSSIRWSRQIWVDTKFYNGNL